MTGFLIYKNKFHFDKIVNWKIKGTWNDSEKKKSTTPKDVGKKFYTV